MKGFGFFVVSILMLSALLAEQMQSGRSVHGEFSAHEANEIRFSRLATLRNAIAKSYQKTDKRRLAAWKTVVESSLARKYGATVAVNGSKVTIASDEARARAEFHLR